MADYTLNDGAGTTVREDGVALEGYVDVDLDGLEEATTIADTDMLMVQDGANDPKKAPYSLVSGMNGFKLSLAYIY